MPNQHKTGPAIYQKCENPSCNEQVRRTPSMVRKNMHLFCSLRCARKAPTKYTDEKAQWIIDNLSKLSFKEMAQHFESKPETFRRTLMRLRKRGYKIPLRRKKREPKQSIAAKKSRLYVEQGITKPAPEIRQKQPQTKGKAEYTRTQRTVVANTPPKPKRLMDQRLPDRKIIEVGTIHITIGKTHFTARDAAHEAEIRKKFAYLEKGVFK
jgi:hypothetical protein